MQNESLFIGCRNHRLLRQRSISMLLVLSGFLFFGATAVNAAEMVLKQQWSYTPTQNAETEAWFDDDTITGSGEETVQVTRFIVSFRLNPKSEQYAQGIVITPPPWEYPIMRIIFQDGVFKSILAEVGYEIRPYLNPSVSEKISMSIYKQNNALYHWPCCTGFIRYYLVPGSSQIEPVLVDFYLYAKFAEHWQQSGCEPANDWCGGADLDQLGNVDMNDLRMFVAEWLNYCPASWSFK